ncbi:MAG: hypothetical protein FJ279_20865 [Planctomycetes bacterium]|nr:hypothetical protein [Planctomycetota bacterium]
MVIAGKASICHKLVFAVEYRFGMTYLDRCGRTMNQIMRLRPEWVLQGSDVNPQNAPLVNLKSGMVFNFSSTHMDVAIEQAGGGKELDEGDVSDFVEQAHFLSGIVVDELELREFTRVGFRVWYLLPSDSKDDSERWIRDLPAFRVSDDLPKAFGGKLEVASYALIIRGVERKYRIAVSAVERHAQIDVPGGLLSVRASKLPKDQHKVFLEQLKAKSRLKANPEFAAMVDVDAFVEDPVAIDAQDFITHSLEQIDQNLPRALQGSC